MSKKPKEPESAADIVIEEQLAHVSLGANLKVAERLPDFAEGTMGRELLNDAKQIWLSQGKLLRLCYDSLSEADKQRLMVTVREYEKEWGLDSP